MKKKPIKVSLSVVILIIAIIAIAIMAYMLYAQKTTSDKQIAELESNATNMQATINDLQSKLNTISETASASDETNQTKINDKVSFTDEQVKECLSNYLELRYAIGTEVLETLSKKGVLKYSKSDDIEKNNETHTKVKFSDYKEAMLNFVSEKEFKTNFDNEGWRKIDNGGYFTVGDGIGGPSIDYTVLSITKTNDTSYTAKTSYTEGGTPGNQNFSFTVTSNNGTCVIDSVK